MSLALTEEDISRQLKKSYQPDGNCLDGWLCREWLMHATLKCAAVLIPLIWWKDEWQLVFTRRTDTRGTP